ncbi:uncharacterized protein [Montipora foliosa]|uniref:uncharacterized protein n=1 Tax=Montipora foliosa TaxID=591990 RepID=UPI0035F21C6A
MKTEDAFVWALTIFFHIKYTQEHFNISRKRPQGDDGWTNGVDHFTIPRILCPQDPNRTCTSFNGLNVGPTRCICQCPSTKTTFAFTESQWHCMDQENNDMRAKMQSVQYSKPVEKGCSTDMRTFFVDEYLNSSLRVLNVGDEKPVSITSEFSSCEVETNYSWYFGCNDSRLLSQEYLTEMKNLFKLEKGSNHYTLKVVTDTLAFELLQGRIINLGIACEKGTATAIASHCILFKLEGTIECLVADTDLNTSSTTITTQSVTISSPPKEPYSPNSTIGPIPTTNELSSLLATNTELAFSTKVAATSAERSSQEAPRDQKQRSNKTNMNSSLAFIASVTVSAVLLTFFFVGVIIIRRTFARQDSDSSGDSQGATPANTLSNLAIPTLDEYSGYFTLSFREAATYASTYRVPRQIRKSSIHHVSNPIDMDLDAMHLYEPIDVPIGHFSRGSGMTLGNAPIASRLQNHRPISREQHVYNIVEEIPATCFTSDGTNDGHNSGMTAGFHNDGNCATNGGCIGDTDETDPVYRVIEEVIYRRTEISQHGMEDPVYCTLEPPYEDIAKWISEC